MYFSSQGQLLEETDYALELHLGPKIEDLGAIHESTVI